MKIKKFTLLILSFPVLINLTAQNKSFFKKLPYQSNFEKKNLIDIDTKQNFIVSSKQTKSLKKTNGINIIDIGTSANAYGFYGNGRTYVWADNNINTIIFTHRMESPGNGRLAYDISKDGGSTWKTNIGPIFLQVDSGARFPQGAIYNPVGNKDPEKAYIAYFAALRDKSNAGPGPSDSPKDSSDWGGYAYGVKSLVDTATSTKHKLSSYLSHKQTIPNAFTITQKGTAFCVEPSVDEKRKSYTDSLIITKGIFNNVTKDYDYTQSMLYCPISKSLRGKGADTSSSSIIADTKIAFSPDGNTGFIALVGHNSFTFSKDSVYYPILYKTTDDGKTWGNPININLNKIDYIRNKIYDDNKIIEIFDSLIDRNLFAFTTGFELDLSIDENNNPHIVTVVGISPSAWSIVTQKNSFAICDIYSTDGGTTWKVLLLSFLESFRGVFGAPPTYIDSYNRCQVGTTMDGKYLFYSWLDTDLDMYSPKEPSLTNSNPDLYVACYYPKTNKITDIVNVTGGTSAEGTAYMGSLSHYILDDGNGKFKLPLVFQELQSNSSISLPVKYKYIQNVDFSLSDFKYNASIEEKQSKNVTVNQNYPNPFRGSTNIGLYLNNKSDVKIDVYNLVGQKLIELNKRNLPLGINNISIDCSNLLPGIYIYNVVTNNTSVTKKMIVE